MTLNGLVQIAVFIVLGVLVFSAFRKQPTGNAAHPSRRFAVFLGGAALTTLVCVARFGWPPSVLILLIAFCNFGIGGVDRVQLCTGVHRYSLAGAKS